MMMERRRARRRPPAQPGAAFVVLLAVLAALAALLRPAPARAGPVRLRFPVRLEYTRGSGAQHCPGEEFLRAEITRRLGDLDPFHPDAPHTVTASVTREEATLLALMELRDATGTVLWVDGFDSPEPCAALVSAMALAIVVEIETVSRTPAGDGEAGEPAAPAGPPSAPPQVETAEPAAPTRPPPVPPSTRPRGAIMEASKQRLRLEGGVGAVVAFGITPGAAGGMALSLAARSSDWSLGLEARALGAFSQKVDDVPIATSVWTAAAVGCLHRRVLYACGLAQVGAYRFAPEALVNIGPRAQPLIALAARAGGEWPLVPGVFVHGYVEVAQHLRDATLRRQWDAGAASQRVLWNASPVGMALGFGVTGTY
jgi:hypothetical protein